MYNQTLPCYLGSKFKNRKKRTVFPESLHQQTQDTVIQVGFQAHSAGLAPAATSDVLCSSTNFGKQRPKGSMPASPQP